MPAREELEDGLPEIVEAGGGGFGDGVLRLGLPKTSEAMGSINPTRNLTKNK